MNFNKFLLQLGLVSALTAVGLYFLHQVPEIYPHQAFSWGGLGFFIIFTLAMYYLVQSALKDSNKNVFFRTFMTMTGFKMLALVMAVMAYSKVAVVESKLFIIPFLVVYLVFTIFETMVMLKMSKEA